jgi:hypothetical protein
MHTDLSVADSPYKNWWAPPDEIIVIKPKEQKASQSNAGQKV